MNDNTGKRVPHLIRLLLFFAGGIVCASLFSAAAPAMEFHPERFADGMTGAHTFRSLLSLLWLPLSALFLSTSTLGVLLIPLLLFLRALLLSVSVALLLKGGTGPAPALLYIGLPALFSLPACFLLCEDALYSSEILCLCSRSSLSRSCGSIAPARLLCSALLLAAALLVQSLIFS